MAEGELGFCRIFGYSTTLFEGHPGSTAGKEGTPCPEAVSPLFVPFTVKPPFRRGNLEMISRFRRQEQGRPYSTTVFLKDHMMSEG